jgi:hypothetical protein
MFSLLFFLIKKVTKKSRQCQGFCRIGFGKFIGIASVGEVATTATQPCGIADGLRKKRWVGTFHCGD